VRLRTQVRVCGDDRLWAQCDGAGLPVVLLHGAGMDSRLWNAVVPRLVHRHLVIRYDARGLGRSTTPSEPFWDVDDLCAVLDHFGLDRAALVGLSMGGETALDFVLTHPGRVSTLTLIGTSVSGHEWPHTAELSAYASARRERDPIRLADLELSIWASMGTAAPGGELIARMVTDNAQRRVASEHLAIYPEQDAISRLEHITAPTLVVHGDQDHPEVATIARRLVTAIAGAQLTVVPGADHYLPLRTPERLTDLLLTHLSRGWPGRAERGPPASGPLPAPQWCDGANAPVRVSYRRVPQRRAR
jgi:3-oxoadipate enol-lactonase